MTQLSRRQYAAIASLILAAGGSIVAACSSDSTPSTTGAPLGPDQGTSPGTGAPPTTGTGGGTASPGDVSNPPAGGTDPVTGTGETAPGDLSIANLEMPAPTPGTETPPTETPPVVTGLQPNCAAAEGTVPALALTQVAANLNRPLFVTGVPGDDSRLMVVERGGTIRVILNGELQEEPFLDVAAQLADEGTNQGEHGLLGLAFHPDYANNGLFYVHFSAAGTQGGPARGNGVISEFKVNADSRSVADPASQRQFLNIPDLESNHNGGMITFGRDRMLYIGMGDGGGQDDVHGATGNGQNLNELHGKLLRIDVAGRGVNDAYGIPAGNLAAQLGRNASPEIWAYGLRNPWRFSFDACNGDLYIGDVGQGLIEEVDFLPANTPAGTNFGWRVMEGPICRPGGDANCVRTGLTMPVDSYDHDVGRSMTGGYVYRGSSIPGLRGTYIYADYSTSVFFRFRLQNGQIADRQDITSQLSPASARVTGISSFGQDNAGEVYVTSFTPGAVYRITAAAQ